MASQVMSEPDPLLARGSHGLDRARPRLSSWLALPAVVILLLISIVFGTSVGAVHIPALNVVAILTGRHMEVFHSQQVILLAVRLPRVLTAGVIGGALSIAGVL